MKEDRGLHTPAEQEEILNKEINPSGAGEHPAVQAVMSDDFQKMSNLEALDVAKALQELIRGNAEIRANQLKQDEEMRKIRQHLAESDEMAQRWNEDRKKFIEETIAKADKVRLSGTAKEKIVAEGANIQVKANEEAQAEAAAERLAFIDKCNKAPKVTISSSGKFWRTKVGEGYTMIPEPEYIRISVGGQNFYWKLQPDTPVEVPDFIAELYWAKKKQAKNFDKMKNVLLPDNKGQYKEYQDIVRAFPELNTENQDIGNAISMNKLGG